MGDGRTVMARRIPGPQLFREVLSALIVVATIGFVLLVEVRL
jgi:hypothetical protein